MNIKQFAAVIAAGIVIGVAYQMHRHRVESAAAVARAEALRSRATPIPSRELEAIGLSRVIEPLFTELFSSLDTSQPADVVPPLELTKERILDRKAAADPAKQHVYDQCIKLLAAMISLGEERTKALEAALRTKAQKAALDAPGATTTTGAFFSQRAVKRWEDEKKRRKPVVDQLFVQLRSAEREWNKRAGPNARVENYDLPASDPIYVTADPSVSYANPLEKGAYNDRRAIYPWRRAYYDRFGYPRY